MKKLMLPLALLVSASFAQSALADTNYMCELSNKKVVYVSTESGSPIYRYGTAAKTDIVLPMATQNSTVYQGQMYFAQGGSRYLRFTNGNYSYVVYNGAGKGWEFEGLVVYNGAKVIMHKECINKLGDLYDLDLDSTLEDPDSGTFGFAPQK